MLEKEGFGSATIGAAEQELVTCQYAIRNQTL